MEKFLIKDAEAAVYAMEAATFFVSNISEMNYVAAFFDVVSFCGWVKNSF